LTSTFAAFHKGDVNRAPHTAVTSLIDRIMKLMVSLLRDIVAKLCKWVRRRIKAVVEAGGDVFY
jgi:hypothetical protein